MSASDVNPVSRMAITPNAVLGGRGFLLGTSPVRSEV